MALKFNDTKGKAQKGADSYEYKDGENTVRIVGGVLPRYVYWLKGTNNKDIPVECLAFSREKEKFDNAEKDWVSTYHPELKCSWSYAVNCIDPKDGKARVLNLKKKLFEQIITLAEDLGDPTDYDTGWDIVFKRVKTGPLAFNVEYTLQQLRCKKRALSEAERAVADADVPVDEKYVRPSADEVKATLEKLQNGTTDSAAATSSETEAVEDL